MKELKNERDEDEELVQCERCGDLVPYDCAYKSVSGGFLCDICYDDLYA
jgi:formylmethanofuran dehydrogenase subunit E